MKKEKFDIMIAKKLQIISKDNDYLSYKDMIDYFADNFKYQ